MVDVRRSAESPEALTLLTERPTKRETVLEGRARARRIQRAMSIGALRSHAGNDRPRGLSELAQSAIAPSQGLQPVGDNGQGHGYGYKKHRTSRDQKEKCSHKGDPWMGTVDDMTCPLQLDISLSSANRMASGRTMDGKQRGGCRGSMSKNGTDVNAYFTSILTLIAPASWPSLPPSFGYPEMSRSPLGSPWQPRQARV